MTHIWTRRVDHKTASQIVQTRFFVSLVGQLILLTHANFLVRKLPCFQIDVVPRADLFTRHANNVIVGVRVDFGAIQIHLFKLNFFIQLTFEQIYFNLTQTSRITHCRVDEGRVFSAQL